MTTPAPKPCESCPYRTDVPSGMWHPDEYAKLVEYDAPTGEQPTAMFQCHQYGAGDAGARLCAGWVACHGQELLSLRLAVARGRVPAEVMQYTTPVEVFPSGTAAARHGLEAIEDPDPAARTLIAKVCRTREDIS